MGKLFQESGGSSASRVAEASDILYKMKLLEKVEEMTMKERGFLEDLHNNFRQFQSSAEVSPLQVYWLRDLKEKYL